MRRVPEVNQMQLIVPEMCIISRVKYPEIFFFNLFQYKIYSSLNSRVIRDCDKGHRIWGEGECHEMASIMPSKLHFVSYFSFTHRIYEIFSRKIFPNKNNVSLMCFKSQEEI